MSGSFFFSVVLRHRVQIPYSFGGSSTSCPDPLSFWWMSDIVPKFPFVSVAFRHHVWISLSFQQLFDIASGSPIVFDGSPALCPNPLSFRRLFDIMPRSLYLFSGSPALCSNPFIFSATFRHRVRIFFFFNNSPASCPDPLSFLQLCSIVLRSFLFSVALQYHVWIPLSF